MTLRPRIGDYEYSRYLIQQHAHALMRVRADEVYQILSSQLVEVARAARDGELHFVRWAIEDSDQNVMDQLTDGLIVGVRDALLALADGDHPEVPEILAGLLASEFSIQRRLALYLLTERPRYIGLVSPNAILPPTTYDVECFHEQMRLLQERFHDLPLQVQNQIHDAIQDGLPPDLIRPADPAAEEQFRVARHLLSVLPNDALPDEVRTLRDRLFERYGRPSHPLFFAWLGAVEWLESPITLEDLRARFREGGFPAMLQTLRKPDDHTPLGPWTETDRAWEHVGMFVEEERETMLGLAELIEPSDFPGAWWYFDAFGRVAKSGKIFDWKPLLRAMQRILSSDVGANVYPSLAQLLKEAASSTTNPAEAGDLPTVTALATEIITRTATPLEEIDDIQDGDIGTHHLNAPAGPASDALIFVLFRHTKDQSTEDEIHTTLPDRIRLNTDVAQALDRAVMTGWGGVELRHSIGKWLHLILWADSHWLDARLDHLLPMDASRIFDFAAWRSYWTGYLLTPGPRRAIMELLRSYYQVLTEDAASPTPAMLKKGIGRDDRDVFGDHLIFGWLQGFDGFGRDGLFGEFMAVVPDDARAAVVYALVRWLREALKDDEAEWNRRVRRELDDFWEQRTEALGESLGDHDIAKELSGFAHWLQLTDVGVEPIEHRLKLIAEHAEPGYDFELLFEYLQRFADREPEPCARLIRVMADRILQVTDPIWYGLDRLPRVIEAVWKSAQDEAPRRILTGVVNDLLEQRGIDLRAVIQ